jgi:hypothetical protein
VARTSGTTGLDGIAGTDFYSSGFTVDSKSDFNSLCPRNVPISCFHYGSLSIRFSWLLAMDLQRYMVPVGSEKEKNTPFEHQRLSLFAGLERNTIVVAERRILFLRLKHLSLVLKIKKNKNASRRYPIGRPSGVCSPQCTAPTTSGTATFGVKTGTLTFNVIRNRQQCGGNE